MSRRDHTKLITRLHRARKELKRLEARGDNSLAIQDLRWFVADAEDMIAEIAVY